jgi:hypothetical protein
MSGAGKVMADASTDLLAKSDRRTAQLDGLKRQG